MKLFNKIWKKNFHNTRPDKLVDDMGPLRGVFQFKGFNHRTGKIVTSEKQNTLVNLSKSSIIRLISQQASPWGDYTDPTSLKISTMRFGNHNSGGANKLLYYDLAEPSCRESVPYVADDDIYAYPGGQQVEKDGNGTTIGADSASSVAKSYSKTDGVTSGNITIFTVRSSDNKRPPDNNTLNVILKKNGVTIETIYFNNSLNLDEDESVYTRTTSGISPISISSTAGYQNSTPYITENSNESSIRQIGETNDGATNTLLYYDYTAGSWKVMIELRDDIDSDAIYDSVTITYTTGANNVVNSIIPKYGYNAGTGITSTLRYKGNDDYYSILSNVEYRDADSALVDDYSASFSVNMGTAMGNGNIDSSDGTNYIRYKEAFLGTDDGNMFSAIYMSTSLDKDPDTSYYVTWTIIAPLN